MIAALAEKIDGGQFHLFCIDSVDAESWYNRQAPPRQRIARHMQYEEYLLHLTGFLDGYYDESCYFLLPTHYLPNPTDPWFLDRFRGLARLADLATDGAALFVRAGKGKSEIKDVHCQIRKSLRRTGNEPT